MLRRGSSSSSRWFRALSWVNPWSIRRAGRWFAIWVMVAFHVRPNLLLAGSMMRSWVIRHSKSKLVLCLPVLFPEMATVTFLTCTWLKRPEVFNIFSRSFPMQGSAPRDLRSLNQFCVNKVMPGPRGLPPSFIISSSGSSTIIHPPGFNSLKRRFSTSSPLGS